MASITIVGPSGHSVTIENVTSTTFSELNKEVVLKCSYRDLKKLGLKTHNRYLHKDNWFCRIIHKLKSLFYGNTKNRRK